jgi:hypothetical protein
MKLGSMQREREAVDSEFQMALPSDYDRVQQVIYLGIRIVTQKKHFYILSDISIFFSWTFIQNFKAPGKAFSSSKHQKCQFFCCQ